VAVFHGKNRPRDQEETELKSHCPPKERNFSRCLTTNSSCWLYFLPSFRLIFRRWNRLKIGQQINNYVHTGSWWRKHWQWNVTAVERHSERIKRRDNNRIDEPAWIKDKMISSVGRFLPINCWCVDHIFNEGKVNFIVCRLQRDHQVLQVIVQQVKIQLSLPQEENILEDELMKSFQFS
jgi:hypothetical protein